MSETSETIVIVHLQSAVAPHYAGAHLAYCSHLNLHSGTPCARLSKIKRTPVSILAGAEKCEGNLH